MSDLGTLGGNWSIAQAVEEHTMRPAAAVSSRPDPNYFNNIAVTSETIAVGTPGPRHTLDPHSRSRRVDSMLECRGVVHHPRPEDSPAPLVVVDDAREFAEQVGGMIDHLGR